MLSQTVIILWRNQSGQQNVTRNDNSLFHIAHQIKLHRRAATLF